MTGPDASSPNPPSGGRTALYHHHGVTDAADVLAAARPLAALGIDPSSVRFLSSWGPLLEPVAGYRPCGHYLAPLDPSFDRAIVLRNTIPLPASGPLAAVLGTILGRMGAGSELYVEGPGLRAGMGVTEEWLGALLPSCPIEPRPHGLKGWFRVGWDTGLDDDVARLACSYPRLVSRIDDFAATLRRTEHPCADPVTAQHDSIENAFTYSMHWALHTHAAVDQVLDLHGIRGPLRVLDVGGSYGFLACELATAGHHVTDLELLRYRVEDVLPWLVEAAGVPGRVEGVARRMEDLEGEAGSLDMVCFMGSLLLVDRDDVAGVLDRAARLLKPGGLIMLRENLLLPENADVGGTRETRFTAAELQAHLGAINDDVTYLCHLGRERTYREVQSLWTVFAAVRTPAKPRRRVGSLLGSLARRKAPR